MMPTKETESTVARNAEDPAGRTKKAIGLTLPPDLHTRALALKARTGMSVSKIAAAALAQRIDAFENDPGELMRNEES